MSNNPIKFSDKEWKQLERVIDRQFAKEQQMEKIMLQQLQQWEREETQYMSLFQRIVHRVKKFIR